jgi:hypothetical protein
MNHPSMFVAWEISKECNARVFRRHDSTAAMVIGKVKNEARAWRFGWSKIFEQCNFATAASLQVLGLVLDNYSKTFVSILIKMTKNASVFLKWQPYARLCCSCVQCMGVWRPFPRTQRNGTDTSGLFHWRRGLFSLTLGSASGMAITNGRCTPLKVSSLKRPGTLFSLLGYALFSRLGASAPQSRSCHACRCITYNQEIRKVNRRLLVLTTNVS